MLKCLGGLRCTQEKACGPSRAADSARGGGAVSECLELHGVCLWRVRRIAWQEDSCRAGLLTWTRTSLRKLVRHHRPLLICSSPFDPQSSAGGARQDRPKLRSESARVVNKRALVCALLFDHHQFLSTLRIAASLGTRTIIRQNNLRTAQLGVSLWTAG